jgi:hypothetical protein
MSLMNEYLNKGMSANDLESELLRLINLYNRKTDTYLAIYASAISKPSIPDNSLNIDDYYIIFDLLRNIDATNLDFYIETPGGSGEAAEEIAKWLRKKFESINYVISGEAKSAGTILVLSGNEISMTQSGSLGPIDAQMRIGRSTISAYDYMEWIKKKQDLAEKEGRLSPFDATMIAQISPGELGSVEHGLRFAEELVANWLTKYKFKDWTETETTRVEVTDDMKLKRAEKIASDLTNHGKWRSHGRSLKIEDLEEIGLRINKIDENLDLADIVYRIQTIIKMLFGTTNVYKIFATADEKLFKTAIQIQNPVSAPPENSQDAVKKIDVIEINVNCPQCGEVHHLYVKFIDNQKIDEDEKIKGFKQFPTDNKLLCKCGFEIDLSGIKNDIETKTGKKIV